jgi:hypothetical protein
MSAADALSDQPEQKKRPERVDLRFELTVLRCAIGCIIEDIPLSDNDYVRLYLAMSRLGKSK